MKTRKGSSTANTTSELVVLSLPDIPIGQVLKFNSNDLTDGVRTVVKSTGWVEDYKGYGYTLDKSVFLSPFSLFEFVDEHKTTGLKEADGKVSYQEINPAYIKLIAMRMGRNKAKYPVNNWKKDINPLELLDAMERHFMDLKCLLLNESPIHNPDETVEDHLAALGANSMMLHYGRSNT